MNERTYGLSFSLNGEPLDVTVTFTVDADGHHMRVPTEPVTLPNGDVLTIAPGACSFLITA